MRRTDPRPDVPAAQAQTVLVLQGGGALGAYQAGVFEALHEKGVEPDWVIGTSIGAINAALISGNPPAQRLERLREFWERVEQAAPSAWPGPWSVPANWWMNLNTVSRGINGFFAPNPASWSGAHAPVGVESAAYYHTAPLRDTLAELVDFDCLGSQGVRLTVGAVNAVTGQMRYFDSRDSALGIDHVMASGALPPAFPAVRIDGEPYWDGGIYSNTPIEAVLDDRPRRDSLIFAVNMWQPRGPEPESIWQVMGRQKDIQYASRAESHIARQKQIHRLRHVIRELGKELPAAAQRSAHVKDLLDWGCSTTMHVVRLLAPRLEGEDHTKDIDFTAAGIRARWQAGYADALEMLRRKPWQRRSDPIEGVLVHELERA
jgi:NTE family protein